MLYRMSNKIIDFAVYFDFDIDINKLQKLLGNYAKFEEQDDIQNNAELIILFVGKKNKLFELDTNLFIIDSHESIYKNNVLCVNVNKNVNEEIIFIKRLLSDLINRFFELKKGFFLHSSSIVDSDKTIIFIGEKGSGKTTNMLYVLNDYPMSYSSNERTGIINIDGKLLTYGNPSSINIRANTLRNNLTLKDKLCECIDINKYNQYCNSKLRRDCSERLIITFDDISKNLNVNVIPFSYLGAICNLIYDPSIDFYMQKIDYQDISKEIEKSIIGGVFPQRDILNNLFPSDDIDFDKILYNQNINYYNIYQNNTKNNIPSIIKTLRKDFQNERN